MMMDELMFDYYRDIALMNLIPDGETEEGWRDFVNWLWSGAR